VEIGIGSKGFKTYALLVVIGRFRPALLERALAPMISPDKSGRDA
jgi:hypothetical protein